MRAIGIVLVVCLWTSLSSAQQPNIVMIFVDDWAWNGTPIRMDDRMQNAAMVEMIEMPNLVTMAESGMRFRNAYGSPQCSPARVCLQTGQSSPRNGFTVYMNTADYYDGNASYEGFPVVPNGSDQTLDPDAVSIPEALSQYGYVSAHIGKWHMRGNPEDEGFAKHDGNTTNVEGQTFEDRPNDHTLEGIEDPKLMNQITNDAIEFMVEQVEAGNPFYVQLSHYAMHEWRECFPSSRARFQNHPAIVAYNRGETDPAEVRRKRDPAVWLGMAYELDLSIGRVNDALEDLGIADNTYVIVVSDNGYREDFFDDISGLSQPLHAHKWWAWQGGIRVPMIVTGPGISAGSVSTANVVNYDFLPTFVDWAGGDSNAMQGLDGISLAGLLAGETPHDDFLNRSLYFHYPHYRTTMPHSVIVKGSHKVVYFYETAVRFPEWEPIMLFDLNSDGGEYHNIYPENPTLANSLYADLMKYLSDVGARMPLVPNPEYNPSVYEGDDDFDYRLDNGPFIGTRPTQSDEWFTSFSDYWMSSWGLDLGLKTDDYDGDGVSNLMEYALGGDPLVPSPFAFAPFFDDNTNDLEWEFTVRNDDSSLNYVFETSSTLLEGSWIEDPAITFEVERTGSSLDRANVSMPLGGAAQFIRFKVEQD